MGANIEAGTQALGFLLQCPQVIPHRPAVRIRKIEDPRAELSDLIVKAV